MKTGDERAYHRHHFETDVNSQRMRGSALILAVPILQDCIIRIRISFICHVSSHKRHIYCGRKVQRIHLSLFSMQRFVLSILVILFAESVFVFFLSQSLSHLQSNHPPWLPWRWICKIWILKRFNVQKSDHPSNSSTLPEGD